MGEVVQTPHYVRIPIVLLTDVEVDLGMLQFCHRLGREAPPHTSLSLIFFYLTSFNLQVDRVEEGGRLAGQLPSPGLIWARVCEGCLRIWWSPPPSPHIFFDS
jgi:hypothetical protein